MAAKGYAYMDEHGVINIATVSPTEISAYVNAIYMISKGQICPTNSCTLKQAQDALHKLTEGKGMVISVVITPHKD